MTNSTNYSRIIFHIDLNAFFCTVAQIKNPALKGKAFAMGRENTYKGVIATASYEARKYGIGAGMSLVDAYKKLPSLIVVESDFDMIRMYHEKFVKLLREYSNLVEVASVDEAYVDMSEKAKTMHPIKICEEIQNRLLKEYGLPSSVGIAPTLFLAKMASNIKKPMGMTILRKREVDKILYPLSVKEIFGIGKKTYPKLIDAKILTIGDFMNEDNRNLIIGLIGMNSYNYVVESITGQSSDEVDPNRYSESQSVSASQTYDIYLISENDILYELRQMAKKIISKIKSDNYLAKTVSITLRNDAFKTITRSKSIDFTDDFLVIFDVVTELVEENYNGEALRLVGVGLSGLESKDDLKEDYNLFNYLDVSAKEENISSLVKYFKEKYGDEVISKGNKKSRK